MTRMREMGSGSFVALQALYTERVWMAVGPRNRAQQNQEGQSGAPHPPAAPNITLPHREVNWPSRRPPVSLFSDGDRF